MSTPTTVKPHAQSLSILVVDDQVSVLRELVDLLGAEFQGVQVFQSADPTRALAIARAERPTVVLTDWDMPGLDGLSLVHALTSDQATADIGCLICTGKHVGSAELRRALELGTKDYLRKPTESVELSARITVAL